MHLSLPLLSILDEIDTTFAIRWVTRIVALIVVWIIVAILVRYLTRWIQSAGRRTKRYNIDDRDLNTIDRLLDYVVVFLGIIVTLGIMGWTNLLISALTAAGVFTIIIGFAVKDVAANFISGIFILIDQPFAPGDFIQVSDFLGTVKTVSLRTTILVTLDGPLVYIPNSVVAVEPMTNYSLAQDRRVNFTISIANDAEVGQALKIISRVLEDEPDLLPERPQVVLVSDVREYAIDISVTAYTSSDALLAVASQLQQQVLAALHANQIELAVPVRKNVYPDLPAVLLQTEDPEQPDGRGES